MPTTVWRDDDGVVHDATRGMRLVVCGMAIESAIEPPMFFLEPYVTCL